MVVMLWVLVSIWSLLPIDAGKKLDVRWIGSAETWSMTRTGASAAARPCGRWDLAGR